MAANFNDPNWWLTVSDTLGRMAWNPVQPQNLAEPMKAYQEQQQAAQQKNATLEWLKQNNPDLAAMVASGMSPNDALSLAYKQKMEAAKPANWKDQYMIANGNIYGAPEQPGAAPRLVSGAPASRTEIEKQLLAAGIDPQSPQGRQIILDKLKPRNTSLTVGPDGTVSFTDGAQATPKVSVDQGKNSGYYLRAKEAEKAVKDFGKEGTSIYNKAAEAMPLGVGNFMITQDAQKLNQAKRDFINAVLRHESGAVISEAEFANAEKQYFPQPGDGPEVIQQKEINRQNAVEGLRISAGPGADMVDKPKDPNTVYDYKDYAP